MDAARVNAACDLFEGGHATGEEVVGDESGDSHHRRASVVELLGLATRRAGPQGKKRNAVCS